MTPKRRSFVHFAPKKKDGFYDTVKEAVDTYFEVNALSHYATPGMWFKTIIMILLYLVPYGFMVSGITQGNAWLFLGMWILMAFGMIGLGTSVMHDANHNTYSPNRAVNKAVGYILDLIGGYTATWKIQHNVLHHTYTNISGIDEDIDNIKFLRFSPRQPLYWYHKYQYLYAWFFYSMMTLYWMTLKDYVKLVRYYKHGLLSNQNVTLIPALLRVTLNKIFYFGYIVILPICFSGMPWYMIFIGFVAMHLTAGIILSCIFQPSHIMEVSQFSVPVETDGNKNMEDSWAVHQLVNTTNFAPGNKFFTWFFGGLNYQIEHHLFTHVCHVHYAEISPLVKSVAGLFNLPYYEQPSFFKALLEHARMLKILGKENVTEA